MDKLRILVFDDNSSDLSRMYSELLLQSFNVEVTGDPKEIAPRGARLVPHIAIVNNSAKFNSHEVCVMIKDNLNIPIVLLIDPGSLSTKYLDGCEADAIINKPINMKELNSVVSRLINNTR